MALISTVNAHDADFLSCPGLCSAAEVPLLDPPVLKICDQVANHDCHLWEHSRQTMDADPARRVRGNHYPVLSHPVVHEDLHSHERRPAARHLRVEEQHAVVLLNVAGQLEIVQFWLSCADVRLDEQTPSSAVRNHPPQTSLESGATAKDNDGAHLTLRR